MKRAIQVTVLAVLLASGCAQKQMTQFEYGQVRLQASGRTINAPALAAADFKPGVYYSVDRPPVQVEIEVKLLEVSRSDQEILGVNWLSGPGQLISAGSLTNTTPKDPPMAMGGMINIGMGSGGSRERGRGSCPHGPGCRKCGGSSGGGLGGGIGLPVITGGEGARSNDVTAIRAIFNLDEMIELSESYVAIEIELGRTSSGTILVQPMLLPIRVAPKVQPETPPVIKPSTTVRILDDQTVQLGGLITETEAEIKQKVPILSDIPMLGRLFKSNDRSIKKNSLIIFLTPHIILNQE